jgi:hypothetical protein
MATYRGYLRPLLPTSRGAPVVVGIALGASWMAAVIAGDDFRERRAAQIWPSHGRGYPGAAFGITSAVPRGPRRAFRLSKPSQRVLSVRLTIFFG